MFLTRKQAEFQAHIQNTRHQYNMPAFEKRIDRACNREGIAKRFDDPMVATSVEVDTQLMDALHQQILVIERTIAQQMPHHDPVAIHLLRSLPGIGKILALVIYYEIQDIARFPQVDNFISYARLVKCPHESAGKRTTGKHSKIGNVHLKWAFSEAVVLFKPGTTDW